MLLGARFQALMVLPALSLAAGGTAEAACRMPGDPDCVDKLLGITGTVDFFATGASFAIDNDADDRPDALLDESTVVVPGPPHPAARPAPDGLPVLRRIALPRR